MKEQEKIALQARSLAVTNLQIWAMALDVIAALNESDIPVMVIKSLPQVEDLYGAPDGRYTADVDVLVPADGAETAIQTAVDLGWQVFDQEWSELPPAGAARSRAIGRRFWHLILTREGAMSVLDVHTDGMDPWRKRALDPAIWLRAIPEERDGVRFFLPGPEDRLLFLCWHFFADSTVRGMEWDRLTDIELILRRPGEIDWRYAVARAREAGVLLPFMLACELVAARSSTPIQPEWRTDVGRIPWRFPVLWAVLRGHAGTLHARQRLVLWFLMQDDVRILFPEWRRRMLPSQTAMEANVGHPLSGPEYVMQLLRRYLSWLGHPGGRR